MSYLILFFVFIIGASVGSFLNVVIDRLIKGESLSGRSHCDFCHHQLSWYDLIPVVSFFLLKGRCRYCHKKLSWQYPVIELATGIIYLIIFQISNIYDLQVFWSLGFLKLLVLWGIFSCFIVIFVSDFKYHLISDSVFLALFGFVFIYKIVLFLPGSSLNVYGILKQVQDDTISSLIVTLPIFLIYFVSRERAMGFGDVILAAIIGFFLGWQKGFLVLYIAVLTGAIYGMVLIIFRLKKLKSKIAFGPFIIIGTIIMMFFGDNILQIIKNIYFL